MEQNIPPEASENRQLQEAVLEEWQERAAQLHHDDASDEPKDPANPASKPNATTEDQVKNFESEGQAQEPVDTDRDDETATTPPGHQRDKRTTI